MSLNVTWLLVPQVLVWVLKLLIYCDFHTQLSKGVKNNGVRCRTCGELDGLLWWPLDESSRKKVLSNERQFFGWKCLADAGGWRRMTRLAWADRKAIVTQVKSRYNWSMPKSILEQTTHRDMKSIGYSSTRPCRLRTGNWGNSSLRLTKIVK